MKKIIVVHPGKQHSLKTAEAINESGNLYRYITTVYDRPGSFTAKIKGLLGEKYKKKIDTRKLSTIPEEKVYQICEVRALIGIAISKVFGLSSVVWHKYNYYLNDCFGRKVAKYAIVHKVDAIISYDNNSSLLFEIIKKYAPSIKLILDVSIANRLYMKENYIHDMEAFGDDRLKTEQKILWDRSVCDRIMREMELADYFIVASSMSKNSLLFSGVSEDKIAIIPYGVDAEKFSFTEKTDIHKPLNIVYVGQISRRKGLHHLLKYAKNNSNSVSLKLAGEVKSNYDLYRKYSDQPNIDFLGFVTRDKLAEVYKESDVFVFPTLGEGYGLVVLEALSCGVPVICSDLAGGNDAIIDGYNGYVFRAGDDDDMHKQIMRIINSEVPISEMSRNARESVMQYTWNRYKSEVVKYLSEIIN